MIFLFYFSLGLIVGFFLNKTLVDNDNSFYNSIKELYEEVCFQNSELIEENMQLRNKLEKIKSFVDSKGKKEGQ